MYKQHKIRIHCPISGREMSVYISTLDYQDVHLTRFDGCETDFNGSTICKKCGDHAIEAFSQGRNTSEYTQSPL